MSSDITLSQGRIAIRCNYNSSSSDFATAIRGRDNVHILIGDKRVGNPTGIAVTDQGNRARVRVSV